MVQLRRKRKASSGPVGGGPDQRVTSGQRATSDGLAKGGFAKGPQGDLERVKGELKQARERCGKLEILTKLSNLLQLLS